MRVPEIPSLIKKIRRAAPVSYFVIKPQNEHKFMMGIVTLTSDYGHQDFYLASLRGSLLQIDPQLNLIDINVSVHPFDITRGAYALKNAYPHFPAGTIHLAAVHTHYQKRPLLVATEYQGHFFLGPDNGILSIVVPEPTPAHQLEVQPSLKHSLAACLAYGVEHLLSEKPLAEIGLPIKQITQRVTWQPVIREDQILGAIVKVDVYGNLMTNIHQTEFARVGQGRPFELYFKRHDPIRELCTGYSDVPMGQTLCFFNETGYLELAVNLGHASNLLGLKQEDSIQIEFL